MAVLSTGGSRWRTCDANNEIAFIPVPDATGLVDHYEDLYKPERWQDPATYIRTVTFQGIDEVCDNALVDQFTYYLDERDTDWLDRTNEFVRGEGGTQSVPRQVEGQDPGSFYGLEISPDEFELVMGLYEKVTQEKAMYLCYHAMARGIHQHARGFEPSMPLPFSEFYETFSTPLQPRLFAAFAVPTWVPSPDRLLHIARIVYPYWRRRRMERGGRRIIPVLNASARWISLTQFSDPCLSSVR